MSRVVLAFAAFLIALPLSGCAVHVRGPRAPRAKRVVVHSHGHHLHVCSRGKCRHWRAKKVVVKRPRAKVVVKKPRAKVVVRKPRVKVVVR